jgi:DNA-binding GntR family transcriptional regulator
MGALAAVLQRISGAQVDALTDAELVESARKGDTEAFSELVRRHQHSVYTLALRFARDPNRPRTSRRRLF